MKRNRLFASVYLDKTRVKRSGRHTKKPNKTSNQKVVHVGFEPTPPKRLELESSALDRSATEPDRD